MFKLFFMLGMVFFLSLAIVGLWTKVLHPFLFGEEIDSIIEDAVEEKTMSEVEKEAEAIKTRKI